MSGAETGVFGERVGFRNGLDRGHDQDVTNAFEHRCFGWLFTAEIDDRSPNAGSGYCLYTTISRE